MVCIFGCGRDDWFEEKIVQENISKAQFEKLMPKIGEVNALIKKNSL